MRKFFCLISALLGLLFFLPATVHATNYTWTGTAGTAWNDSGNWTPSGIPGPSDSVGIATTANSPVLDADRTIMRFVIGSGALDLQGYKLSVTGTALFLGGTISNGDIQCTGLSADFAGTTFTATVSATCSYIYLNGSTFNAPTSFTKTGDDNSGGNGGNHFTAPVSITVTGAGTLYTGFNSPDIFDAVLTLSNSGTGSISLAHTSAYNEFNENIVFNITGSGYIMTGAGGGAATLADTKTIKPGTGTGNGFTGGALQLYNFTQSGSTPQSFTGGSAAGLVLGGGTTFNGPVDFTAGGITLNGAQFNSTAKFTKTGTTDSQGNGGNYFAGETTFINTSSRTFVSAIFQPDYFNGDLHLINTGGSLLYLSYSAGTDFNGNISFENTGGGEIGFGIEGGLSTLDSGSTLSIGPLGFTSGNLKLHAFNQNGATPQNLTLTGSAALYLGRDWRGENISVFNGNVTFTAPALYLEGTTFSGNASFTQTGTVSPLSKGGNIFNGLTSVVNTGTGGIYFGSTNNDIFNGDVTIANTSSGVISLAYASSGNEFNGNITVNNPGGGIMAFSGLGGSSELAAGKTVSVGSSGFASGSLSFKNFTQTDSAISQNLALTGTSSLYLETGTVFNGPVNFTAGQIYFNGATFNNQGDFIQTGPGNGTGSGGTTFNGPSATIVNNGTGMLYMATSARDKFNTNVTFTNSSSGSVYPANHAPDNLFNGNIVVNNTGSGSIYFGVSDGTSALASGKTISVGSGGFASGSLVLKNFTQADSVTPQNILLTGTALLHLNTGTSFGSEAHFTAPDLRLNGGTFKKEATFIKTGASNSPGSAGNTFYGPVTITNNGAGYFQSYGDDLFYSDVTFSRNSTGNLIISSYNLTRFYGNITNNGNVTYGDSGGGFSVEGDNPQVLAGTDVPVFHSFTVNKSANDLTLNIGMTVYSQLNLTKGKIISDSSAVLRLEDNAVVTGSGPASFVAGPVRKVGNDAFTFPVGKANDYRPVHISAPAAASDIFTADYINAMPPSPLSSDTSISAVSDCEYWNISRESGTSPIAVTLYWDASTCTYLDLQKVKVARYSDTIWQNVGGTGLVSAMPGSVTSGSVSDFGFFTYSAADSLPVPVIVAENGTHLCTGSSLNLTTNLPYHSYKWTRAGSISTIGTGRTITITQGGTYQVEVSDASGRKVSSQPLVITESAVPVVLAQGDTACKGSPAILTVNATAGASYDWDVDGNGTTDVTTSSPALSYTYASAGTYTAIVTVRAGGCANSDTTTALVWNTPVISGISKSDVNCPDQYSAVTGWYNTGTITVNATGGTGSLNYSLDNASWQPGATFSSLIKGNYTAWVKDANGCKAGASTEILYKGPVITSVCSDHANCIPGGATRIGFLVNRQSPSSACSFSYRVKRKSDGTVVYNGTGTFNQQENDDISDAAPGLYTFQLLPGGCNSCDTIARDFTISSPPSFTVSASNFNNPSATNIFYTCGLTGGLKMTFKVVNSDNNQCTVPTLTYTDSLFRLDTQTGLYVFAGNTYNGGKDTVSFNLTPGKYRFSSRIMPYGCSASAFYFEIQNTTLQIDVSVSNPRCPGNEGSATAIILSGSDPIGYQWFVSGNTSDTLSRGYRISGLAAGDYALHVTDGRGCLRTSDFTIADPPAMPVPVINTGSCSATASVSDNGRGPFTFQWFRLEPGQRQVPDTAWARLYPDSTLKMITISDTITKGVFSETIYTPVSGYYVSDPQQADTSLLLEPGRYIVRVTDGYGCERYSEAATVQPAAFARSYKIYFRWKGIPAPHPEPPENEDPGIGTFTMSSSDMAVTMEAQAQDCVNRKVAAVSAQYTAFCSSPDSVSDYLTLRYSQRYHHATLYYYDRAGNLTKTVSPKGVNLLAVKPSTRNESPAYPLATTYEYNSLKQLVSQQSPDGGATRFLYNDKGQLRFSQNDRQARENVFSYTRYDYLGRVTEAGESDLMLSSFTALDDPLYLLEDSITGRSYPYSGNHEQTWTVYTKPAGWASYMGTRPQRLLQNRVSYTATRNRNGDTAYTCYSYDPHGNVEWIQQDIPGFSSSWIGYDYDLVSNKVLQVKYNEYLKDKLFHRYSYDEDNRLVSVETSRDGFLWDRDASYSYYAYGPLARTSLGQDLLQGIDYTYTIQGWLKGINAPNLSPSEDPGRDGLLPQSGAAFAADQFGMALGYFDGDFVRSGSPLSSVSANPYHLTNYGKNLYNGNISTWTSRIEAARATGDSLTGFAYTYDRLNRIKDAKFHVFGTAFTPSASYSEQFSYDANGNILSLNRRATSDMDQLAYSYYSGTNRLKRVTDNIDPAAWKEDIDSQPDLNYRYDEIGNLVRDSSENIDIQWNAYGKVSEVVPYQYVAGKHQAHLRFTYDASGNRIAKEVNDSVFTAGGIQQRLPEYLRTTYYVRDASGNIMAVYERTNVPFSGDSIYTAVYTLKEAPLYGSDRLGSWNRNDTVAMVRFHKNDVDRLSFRTDDHLQRENAVDSSLAVFRLRQAVRLAGLTGTRTLEGTVLKVKANDASLLSAAGMASDTAFLGASGNNLALGADSSGNIRFYAVGAASYFGAKDVLLLFDRDGNLMPGSEGLAADSRAKAVTLALPGSGSEHLLFTRKPDGKLAYLRIDMNAIGNGALTGGVKGTVVRIDSLDAPAGTTGFGRYMAVAEDRTGNKAYILATSWKQDTTLIQKITVDETGALDVSVQARIPGKDSLGQGALEISPDGKQLLIYQHGRRAGWFAHRSAQIITFGLTPDFSLYSEKVPASDSLPRCAGCLTPEQTQKVPYVTLPVSTLSMSPDGKEVMYSQNSLVKMSLASGSQRAMWKYELFTGKYQLADTGKSGDLIRTSEGATLTAGVNRKAGVQYVWDGEGNFVKSSYIVAGDTLYAARWPQENHVILKASAYQELLASRYVGGKSYELKDHLGNVRVVISDEKIAETDASGNILKLKVKVRDYTNYYAFGMAMPGRRMISPDGYRFGFNGKEKDSEWNSGGAMYDYGFRIYDPRIAKFLSVDPLTKSYPWYTPYQFAGNSPVKFIDLDGLEPTGNPADWEIFPGSTTFHPGSLVRFYVLNKDGKSGYWVYTDPSTSGNKYYYHDGDEWKLFRDEEQMANDYAKTRVDFATTFAEVSVFVLETAVGAYVGAALVAEQALERVLIKQATVKTVKQTISKAQRLAKFIEKLENAEPAENVDEAIKMINKNLDEVEDMYSGVKKTNGIPNRDDGRMYGILDDKYVKKLDDGSVIANTKGNRVVIKKDGSFKIQSKDGTKTFFEKSGKRR